MNIERALCNAIYEFWRLHCGSIDALSPSLSFCSSLWCISKSIKSLLLNPTKQWTYSEKNMEISLKGLFWSDINIFEIVLVNTNKHQHLHNMVRVRQSYNYPRWNVKFVEFQAIDIPSSIWVRRVWVKAREREGENNDLNIFMAFCSIHQCYSNHFVTNFEESPTKWK